MKAIIFFCGIYSLAFALFHVVFWRLFRWKQELTKLTVFNRAITQILNLRIIYFFLFVAVLCFAFPSELVSSRLGKAFLAGISLFWLGRTIEQFIFFRMNNKWVNILTFIFITGAILFALPLIIAS